MKVISLDDARAWVKNHAPKNFVGHETVKVLGIEPSKDRAVCDGFDEALSLKVVGRLEFGKEYTVEQILEQGVIPYLITKVG